MKLLFVPVIVLAVCFFQQVATVNIVNESDVKFDSIRMTINDYSVLLSDVYPLGSITHKFEKRFVKAKYDVLYTFKCYSKDSLRIKEIIFSNDLGHVPNDFKVRITDKLKLVQL